MPCQTPPRLNPAKYTSPVVTQHLNQHQVRTSQLVTLLYYATVVIDTRTGEARVPLKMQALHLQAKHPRGPKDSELNNILRQHLRKTASKPT